MATTRGGCPVLPGFDPQAIDPYPSLAQARRDTPVFYMPEYDMWCVTRFDDIEAVLRDTNTYSSDKFVDLPPFPDEIAAALPNGHPLESTLVSIDPPAHTRVRKRAQKAFTPRQAAAHIDDVRELANSLIDDFVQHGRVELATAYCTQIPIRVIGPILGVSMEDTARLYQWGMQAMVLVGNGWQLSEEQLLEYGRGQVQLARYVHDLIENRRANPRDEHDLITSLISAEGDDGQPALDDDEIVGVVTSSIAGSSDTAATTMGHCIDSLLEDRSRWEDVLAHPDLIENAIEEALRTRGPARSLKRTTTRESTLNGVTIPEGATLFVHIGSGSRDETVFEDPDCFDLHRENARRHFGFGRWTHFCAGAPLARMEIRVAIETLAERVPSLRLVPGRELEYLPSIQVLPLIGGLVVEWDT